MEVLQSPFGPHHEVEQTTTENDQAEQRMQDALPERLRTKARIRHLNTLSLSMHAASKPATLWSSLPSIWRSRLRSRARCSGVLTEALRVSMDGVAGLAGCVSTVRAHRKVPIDVKLRVITVVQVSSRRCTLAIQNANGNDRG
jgi:hypothetical protein